MKILDDYFFDDCLFVDMKWGARMNEVSFSVEAYPPSEFVDDNRRKCLIQLLCKKPISVTIQLSDMFWTDVELNYDVSGNDQRSNEIENIVVEHDNNKWELKIRSDYLCADVVCQYIEIIKPRSE